MRTTTCGALGCPAGLPEGKLAAAVAAAALILLEASDAILLELARATLIRSLTLDSMVRGVATSAEPAEMSAWICWLRGVSATGTEARAWLDALRAASAAALIAPPKALPARLRPPIAVLKAPSAAAEPALLAMLSTAAAR